MCLTPLLAACRVRQDLRSKLCMRQTKQLQADLAEEIAARISKPKQFQPSTC
jgi:hypothetical protein